MGKARGKAGKNSSRISAEGKACTVMHNAASDISENWLNRAFLGQNQALFGPENSQNIENKHFS